MLVNILYDLKDAHFEMNASHLKKAPSTLLKLYSTPLTNKRSYERITPKY